MLWILINLIRIRLWIQPRPKIEENSAVFFLIFFNKKYNTQKYDFCLLFISLLFENINQKSYLFLKVKWFSYNFG